jgi:hypothetical protein
MDASILTTFFCFILLVVSILLFTQIRDLSNHVNVHMDRSDLHSAQLNTCLSILQQLESKIDLMFNNSPPVPGETSINDSPSERAAGLDIINWADCRWQNAPGEEQPDMDNADMQVSTIVPTHKPEDVLRAVIKAREDFEAKRPYAKSKPAHATIELPAPARKKPGPKPGTTKGIKRGPYKKTRKIT